MPEEGEVYWDDVLNEEILVIDVSEEELVIEHDSIKPREYPKWQWQINVSCGRFEKVRAVGEIDEPEQEETAEKESLFDF